MVVANNSAEQINTALLLIQRRIDRIVQALNTFTTNLNKCKTVEEIASLKLTIGE